MRRRRYLAAAAGVGTVGLAGCFGDANTDNPRAVVRAYLEAEHDEGDPEAMANLLHSDSPLDPTAGETDIDARSVQIEELLVEDRNLSSELLEGLRMRLSADTANSIAGQENALVEATYEIDPPELSRDGADNPTPSGRITVKNSVLTAVETDDWLVVAFQIL